jgi:hypothetical protein
MHPEPNRKCSRRPDLDPPTDPSTQSNANLSVNRLPFVIYLHGIPISIPPELTSQWTEIPGKMPISSTRELEQGCASAMAVFIPVHAVADGESLVNRSLRKWSVPGPKVRTTPSAASILTSAVRLPTAMSRRLGPGGTVQVQALGPGPVFPDLLCCPCVSPSVEVDADRLRV